MVVGIKPDHFERRNLCCQILSILLDSQTLRNGLLSVMHGNCVLKLRFVAMFCSLFPLVSFFLSPLKSTDIHVHAQVTVADFCQTSIGRMKTVMQVPHITPGKPICTGSLHT